MCCSLLRHGRDLSLPKTPYVCFVVRPRHLRAVDIVDMFAAAKGGSEEK